MKKYAKATWNGSGFDGNGNLDLQSQIISGALYTFNSRFNGTIGTNPEELLAAAHASDFTMKLSFILTEAGYTPQELTTICFVDFDKGRLVSSTLQITASVTGIQQETFNEYVKEANETCPISCALNLTIILDTHLLTQVNHKPITMAFLANQTNSAGRLD